MKTLFIAVVLAAAAWFAYSRFMKPAVLPPVAQPNAAVRYTNSLQNDVQKAETAADKANAAIKAMSQESQKGDQPQ